MSLPASGVAADVVINPKKSLLTADFADVLNEVEPRVRSDRTEIVR